MPFVCNKIKKDIKIGVVIPTFNSSNTIKRALLSVLNQNTKNYIDIVIYDDGSDDFEELQNIVDSFKSEIKSNINLSLYRGLTNKGASFARNFIIQKLYECDYIALLDSDDIWHPSKLELQINCMLKNDSYISAHGYIFDLTQRKFKPITNKLKYKYFSANKLLFYKQIFTPTIVIKREFIKFLYRCEYKTSEDWLFYLENLISADVQHKILYLEEELAAGFKFPIGVSGATSSTDLCHKDRMRAISMLHELFLINNLQCNLSKFLEIVKYEVRKVRILWNTH
jgi:glycosyltransferase involved in cell wall biosynthesis